MCVTLDKWNGELTNEHLVHDDSEAPPVTELVVAGLHEDLWSDVVWGAHCGEGLVRQRG